MNYMHFFRDAKKQTCVLDLMKLYHPERVVKTRDDT